MAKQAGTGTFALPDKTYTALKWIVAIVLPAVATFYFTLGGLWGFPNIEQVVGTIVATETFLGVILGVSAVSYGRMDKGQDDAL